MEQVKRWFERYAKSAESIRVLDENWVARRAFVATQQFIAPGP
jgi:hypothetical protein